MSKNIKYWVSLVLIAFIAYWYSGCDSDTVIGNGPGGPHLGGYDKNEAGIMMTLAALCYTAEGNLNALQIRDSISIQLSDTSYSTGGRWEVVWGPGLSPSGGNLMYVAVDSTQDTIQYALCVRGTILNLSDIIEDANVLTMVPWPYSGTADSIAIGSFEGLDTLMSTTDPLTNASLSAFLGTLNYSKQKMFITGHSLGGAMATLFTRWFVDMNYTSKFRLESYTFAAPTVGNVTFASSFNSKMSSAGAENHRCVNTKDLVPYGWAGLGNIVPDNIPTTVPPLVAAAIQTLDQYMRDSGIVYKHVETRMPLGSFDPVGCGPSGELSTYECWVGFEHSSATYLRLLDADTINWGRNSHMIRKINTAR